MGWDDSTADGHRKQHFQVSHRQSANYTQKLFSAVSENVQRQGRIIHEAGEAGEAETSGPGPWQGLGPPGTTKIYKVWPFWAQKFLERKFAVF